MIGTNKKNLVIILLIVVIAISAGFMFLGLTKSNSNAMGFAYVTDVVSDTDNLSVIQQQEKTNLDAMINYQATSINAQTKPRNANFSEIKEAERYLTLQDIEGNEEYLYAEYIGGGYAIYDRLGEFLYEQSLYGSGPFNRFDDGSKLYYGGPSQFYCLTQDGYKHVITDVEVTDLALQSSSEGLECVRQEYKNGTKTEMGLSQLGARAVAETFTLGQNIKESDPTRDGAMFYHSLRGYAYDKNYISGKTFQVWQDSYFNVTDVYNGKNYYGSCAFVSLSSVMMYYDRIGKINMIPDDLSGLPIMYSHGASFSNSVIPNGAIADINANLIRTEILHQNLLYSTFPQLRGKVASYHGNTFAYEAKNLGGVYSSFASANQLTQCSFSTKSGTYLLPEQIVKGNPVIISLDDNYPYAPAAGKHGAVAYAFTGTKGLWYTVNSVICDYGLEGLKDDGYSGLAVEVNKNFVLNSSYFNVY